MGCGGAFSVSGQCVVIESFKEVRSQMEFSLVGMACLVPLGNYLIISSVIPLGEGGHRGIETMIILIP